MKKILVVLISLFVLYGCKPGSQNDTTSQTATKLFDLDTILVYDMPSSIRALEVFNEKTVWFAGARGEFGYTENGGASWRIDSLKYDTINPHFRSIAVTQDAVYLLCVGTPALLYKSSDKGLNWSLVYKEEGETVFYDAMDFWNEQEGIAMGDPTDGCLSVIITRDGGNTWNKLSCDVLPATVEGEAAFAASNSNVALYGDHAWIVSGGSEARVFHSPDKGKSWSVYDTPIISGGPMTGIFSVDFYDENEGVIFGGDWENKDQNSKNVAVTNDGGKTWRLVSDGEGPGYRSCVQFVSKAFGDHLIAVGTPGISVSLDAGTSWEQVSNESYYSVRVTDSYTTWLSGDKKIGRIKWK